MSLLEPPAATSPGSYGDQQGLAEEKGGWWSSCLLLSAEKRSRWHSSGIELRSGLMAWLWRLTDMVVPWLWHGCDMVMTPDWHGYDMAIPRRPQDSDLWPNNLWPVHKLYGIKHNVVHRQSYTQTTLYTDTHFVWRHGPYIQTHTWSGGMAAYSSVAVMYGLSSPSVRDLKASLNSSVLATFSVVRDIMNCDIIMCYYHVVLSCDIIMWSSYWLVL